MENIMENTEEVIGFAKGEKCNRWINPLNKYCDGIIDEGYKEGCCSCHINPPCSYCTTDTSYCENCGYRAEDDKYQSAAKVRFDLSQMIVKHS